MKKIPRKGRKGKQKSKRRGRQRENKGKGNQMLSKGINTVDKLNGFMQCEVDKSERRIREDLQKENGHLIPNIKRSVRTTM